MAHIGVHNPYMIPFMRSFALHDPLTTSFDSSSDTCVHIYIYICTYPVCDHLSRSLDSSSEIYIYICTDIYIYMHISSM